MNHGDATTDGPTPALSVVIVVFAGGDAVTRTLDALAPQIGPAGGEMVCAYAEPFAVAGAWRTRYPQVRWIAAPAGTTPAALRSAAVRASRGRILACTEDHCVPAADWCARILAAHASASGVVGGAIEKAMPAVPGAWAAYLLEYSRYMPPLPAGDAEYLSDCNVSYARAALDEVADSWAGEFHESAVHWALAARGHRPRLDPSILVRQDRAVHMGDFLRERVEHGRIFAGTRVAHVSLAGRAALAAKALVLPVVMLARVVARLRGRRALARVPGAAWIPLAGAAVAWSVGELAGYVTGRGR